MKTINSQIIAIPRKNIDTDLIIPADYLKGTVKTGLGKHLFERVRNDEDFSNFLKFSDSNILVTYDNFGCGSSREHAAWALKDFGIQIVISSSFADIFMSNAMKNGIIPIVLPKDIIEVIFFNAGKHEYKIKVDLPEEIIELPDGLKHSFPIDPYRKMCLMKGMDDMDYLLSEKVAISDFNRKHVSNLFFNTKGL